jgi:hypothetical protein
MRFATSYFFVEGSDDFRYEEGILSVGDVRLIKDDDIDLRLLLIGALYPNAEISSDNEGQIVIYTGEKI